MAGVGEELQLLRATLLPGEFGWRGTSEEAEAWENACAAYEEHGAPIEVPVHVSLRVHKELGIVMLAKLDPAKASPSVRVAVEREDLVRKAELQALADARLDECEAQGGPPH